MIAYNHTWLDNLLIEKDTEKAQEEGLISKEELKAIKEKYPVGFYTPNLFIRIGLFILTPIIASFTLGFFSLFLLDALSEAFGVLFILFAFISYAALEFMVQRKNHFRSGVDDALMLMTISFIISGISITGDISNLGYAIIVFLLCTWMWLRFSSTFMSAVAFLSLLAVVFLSYIKAGQIAKATTPFLIMVLCAVIYFIIKKQLKNTRFRHYTASLTVIEVLALVCFYIAGNYFVVREASNEMFGLHLKDGETIPLGWFFWILTIIVPPAYIAAGIYKKDKVLLRTGLILVAAMIFTIRTYYYILPIEMAMCIGGLIMILTAYLLIKYLKEPKAGFTYKEDLDKHLMDKLQVEAIIITETLGVPQTIPDTGTQFGGGSGGGGGATGNY